MIDFTTVVADPPWHYNDKLRMSDVKRSAEDQYDTMSVDEICAMGKGDAIVGYPLATDAFLWLWTTNPFLLDGSAARVAKAWGFTPKQIVTWVKGRLTAKPDLVLNVGMGHITRGCTEQLLVCTRGKTKDLVLDHSVPNVILATRGKHSAKPEESYRVIEKVCPPSYLELFARTRRIGWTQHGNQLED